MDLINYNPILKRNLSDAYVALITYYFASKQYARELIYLKKNDSLTRQLGISTNISVNKSLEDSFDNSDQIRFKLNIEHINLTISHAIPLGLIINEAVTNSIRIGIVRA